MLRSLPLYDLGYYSLLQKQRNGSTEEGKGSEVAQKSLLFFQYAGPVVHNLKIDFHSNVTEELKVHKDEKNLNYLDLSGTHATDEDLKFIAENFPNLACLNLRGCKKITAAGLKQLSTLIHLKSLDLSITDIKDAELESIALILKNLKSLDLSATDLKDVGLKSIALVLKNLKSLNLNNTEITGAGLEDLITILTHLDTLQLCYTKITNVGLNSIAPVLSNLIFLDLRYTGITDLSSIFLTVEKNRTNPEKLIISTTGKFKIPESLKDKITITHNPAWCHYSTL
jgi:uncharacterized protein YjbI with pentapeptide repeats